MKKSGIAVLNYGAQYAKQIGKWVRMLGEWCELVMPNTPPKYFENAIGIIHSGSMYSVHDKNAPMPNSEVLELDKPQFGFCYGQQMMQYLLEGEVVRGEKGEYGDTELHVLDKSDIFKGLKDIEHVLMSHMDVVKKPASGHVRIGRTKNSPYAALRDSKNKLYGVQFHPEVYDTPCGRDILSNFLDICNSKRGWSPGDLIKEKVNCTREGVRNRDAMVLYSGGKDSTTVVKIADKALDHDKLWYLHIITGLNTEDEAINAKAMIHQAGITKNVHIVDASDTFYKRLEGVSNDKEKRIIIGNTFFDVADDFASKLGLSKDYVIIQGTLYTDIVESSAATGTEDQIKIHHNLCPRSKEFRKQKRMVEPLSDYFKDDSIELGLKIGTPEKVIKDEPNPGPGLGCRTKCIPKGFRYDPIRLGKINDRANEITQEYGLTAYVRPYTTVGTKGDRRTVAHPAIIEGEIDEKIFKEVSKILPDSVNEINRVWYLLEPRKVDSIQLQQGKFITRDRIDRLRKYEAAIKKTIKKNKNTPKYTQFPVFLIPDNINNNDELVVLRPFFSPDYMTGDAVWLPHEITEDICNAIDEVNDEYSYREVAKAIEGTDKPPSTTELE